MIVSISFRHYLSIRHLSAAAVFAKRCLAVESMPLRPVIDGPEWQEHSAASVSSVIMAVAFLEATINELFCDCADEPTLPHTEGLRARALLGAMWKQGIPRRAGYPILQKYEVALELSERPKFDRSRRIYQDAKLLIELRNALMHFEPQTISSTLPGEEERVDKFERLRGKFPENGLAGAGNPYYPDRLLGAGCARWALRSAVSFADEFYGKLGIEPIYASAKAAYLD